MIAFLQGRVADLAPDAVVLDVAGVGYRVSVPGRLASELALGDLVTLHTQLVLRENEVALFGARDQATLALFQLLVTVNGVGPRLALAMLTTWPAEALAQAIGAGDLAALTAVPGVGRRTAERVVLDLRGKVGAWSPGAEAGPGVVAALAEDAEAVAALGALGYSAVEARRALAAAGMGPGATVEARVFAALRYLGGGS